MTRKTPIMPYPPTPPKKFDFAQAERRPWQERFSGTLIMALVIQLLTGLWWAASLDTRVKAQETWIAQHQNIIAQLCRLEERISSLHEEMNEWEAQKHG